MAVVFIHSTKQHLLLKKLDKKGGRRENFKNLQTATVREPNKVGYVLLYRAVSWWLGLLRTSDDMGRGDAKCSRNLVF